MHEYVYPLLICRFPDDKLHPLDTPQEALQLLRVIGGHKVKDVLYRDRRAHLLADDVAYELATPEVLRCCDITL